MGSVAPKSETSLSPEALSAKRSAQITGGWEIVATSNQATSTINETRVEIQFSESKNGKLTGSPTRVFGLVYPGPPLSHDLFFLISFQVGGLCSSVANTSFPPTLVGRVQTKNPHEPAQVGLTLKEAPGVEFDLDGTLQSDGTITGTYSGGGTNCADSGSFVAKPAVSLSGSYFNFSPGGCITCVSAVVSESSTVSPPAVTMALTAMTFLPPVPISCTTTFNGTVIGNAPQVSGIIPDLEACGTGTEQTMQGIYFQNPIVLQTTIPAVLLFFEPDGTFGFFFLPN